MSRNNFFKKFHCKGKEGNWIVARRVSAIKKDFLKIRMYRHTECVS